MVNPPAQTIALANAAERAAIYRLRHDVYAVELGQHASNTSGVLRDALDETNEYIVARSGSELLGFVSITPPASGRYSLEKYLPRDRLPLSADGRTFEVRLLTVPQTRRGRGLAALLMRAAWRRIEEQGGTRIVAMGRTALLRIYRKVGLRSAGVRIHSGAVEFELLYADVCDLHAQRERNARMVERLDRQADWQLPIPPQSQAACFHGGRFFEAIGEDFRRLERRHDIINADVLDAWFDPSPAVQTVLREHLPWLLRTSPPTRADGMRCEIAAARAVPAECVLPGAGSSDLIFLAMRHWLSPASRALILEPMYGEYRHLLEQVIGCRVDSIVLRREREYRLDPDELAAALDREYDWVALVNPNSPTGQHLARRELEAALRRAPSRTRVWIDETYIDYVGRGQSLERFAAASGRVIVCKSMSKVYALSGVRAAYLCGPERLLEPLRCIAPPWAVSLPAQLAAVTALRDRHYYARRHRETGRLREQLIAGLRGIPGVEPIPGCANFVLFHLGQELPEAAAVVERCRARGLYLRNAAGMGRNLGDRAIRIAVKDADTNARILSILAAVVEQTAAAEVRHSGKPAPLGIVEV